MLFTNIIAVQLVAVTTVMAGDETLTQVGLSLFTHFHTEKNSRSDKEEIIALKTKLDLGDEEEIFYSVSLTTGIYFDSASPDGSWFNTDKNAGGLHLHPEFSITIR